MRLLPLVLLPLLGCEGFGLATPVLELDDTAGSFADDVSTGDESLAGDLPETTVPLTDRVYAVTAGQLSVAEPPGLDGLIGEILDRPVLVHVAAETEATLSLEAALAAPDGDQNPCEAVRGFPAADWSGNPRFVAGPGRLDTRFAGNPASFRDLELTGAFDADGGAWREGTLSATLDTREIAPALGDIDDVCALVAELGGSCFACEDGADACFALRLDGIVADAVDVAFDPTPDTAGCR
jgi:hypothetical protein